MSTKTLKELKPTPYNPRKPWTDDEAKDFLRSLAEFGDLSGVILNRKTGHLVGGNKRVEAFYSSSDVKFEVVNRSDKPDKAGTVAHGYVVVDGVRFAFREVQWDERKEKAANIAANRWGAAWDDDGLKKLLAELEGNMDLALTGFGADELDAMLKPEHFDSTKLPDATPVQEVAPQAFIIYLTFRTREDLLEALGLLTGGVRKSLPDGGKFAHVDGDGPANAEGTERVIDALRKLKV